MTLAVVKTRKYPLDVNCRATMICKPETAKLQDYFFQTLMPPWTTITSGPSNHDFELGQRLVVGLLPLCALVTFLKGGSLLLLLLLLLGGLQQQPQGIARAWGARCILASQTHSTGTYGNNMSVNIKLELLKIQVVAMLHLLYGPACWSSSSTRGFPGPVQGDGWEGLPHMMILTLASLSIYIDIHK